MLEDLHPSGAVVGLHIAGVMPLKSEDGFLLITQWGTGLDGRSLRELV